MIPNSDHNLQGMEKNSKSSFMLAQARQVQQGVQTIFPEV